MMKICRYCGQPNLDDANYCAHCGKAIGIDAQPPFRFYQLNRQSNSDEILNAMKSEYNIQLREGLTQINHLKDLLQQSFAKAPLMILNQEQQAYWKMLDKAQWEILEVQAAYRALEYFFGVLLQATNQEIEMQNFRTAKQEWMQEVSEEIMITPLHLMEEHHHTLDTLHMLYIMALPAK